MENSAQGQSRDQPASSGFKIRLILGGFIIFIAIGIGISLALVTSKKVPPKLEPTPNPEGAKVVAVGKDSQKLIIGTIEKIEKDQSKFPIFVVKSQAPEGKTYKIRPDGDTEIAERSYENSNLLHPEYLDTAVTRQQLKVGDKVEVISRDNIFGKEELENINSITVLGESN